MGKNLVKVKTTFLFCDGGSCQKASSERVLREARAHLRNEGLWNHTHSIRTRCNGRCEDAPTLIVEPGNFWYKNITPEKVIKIVDSHLKLDQPVDEYLLYQEGWDKMSSENERAAKPSVFHEKLDSEYGKVLIVRSSASDQYIYPLFKKLFENFFHFSITFPDNSEHTISSKHKVIYEDMFDVNVKGSDVNFTLAIGPITKTIEKKVSQEIKNRKVSIAEVIWDQKNLDYIGYLRIKNRKGKFLVSIHIPRDNEDAWNYILSIYLNMDVNNPKIMRSCEKPTN